LPFRAAALRYRQKRRRDAAADTTLRKAMPFTRFFDDTLPEVSQPPARCCCFAAAAPFSRRATLAAAAASHYFLMFALRHICRRC